MKTYSQSITAALLLTGGVALALLGLRPVAPIEVVRSSLSQTTAPATPTAVPLLDTSGRISTSTCAGVPPPQAVATLPAIARPTAPPPAKDAALKALPSAEQQSLFFPRPQWSSSTPRAVTPVSYTLSWCHCPPQVAISVLAQTPIHPIPASSFLVSAMFRFNWGGLGVSETCGAGPAHEIAAG
jgi:hypothetical protein